MTVCSARRYGSEMMCGKCGLCWDVNDSNPPVCGNESKTRNQLIAERTLRENRELLNTKPGELNNETRHRI